MSVKWPRETSPASEGSARSLARPLIGAKAPLAPANCLPLGFTLTTWSAPRPPPNPLRSCGYVFTRSASPPPLEFHVHVILHVGVHLECLLRPLEGGHAGLHLRILLTQAVKGRHDLDGCVRYTGDSSQRGDHECLCNTLSRVLASQGGGGFKQGSVEGRARHGSSAQQYGARAFIGECMSV